MYTCIHYTILNIIYFTIIKDNITYWKWTNINVNFLHFHFNYLSYNFYIITFYQSLNTTMSQLTICSRSVIVLWIISNTKNVTDIISHACQYAKHFSFCHVYQCFEKSNIYSNIHVKVPNWNWFMQISSCLNADLHVMLHKSFHQGSKLSGRILCINFFYYRLFYYLPTSVVCYQTCSYCKVNI